MPALSAFLHYKWASFPNSGKKRVEKFLRMVGPEKAPLPHQFKPLVNPAQKLQCNNSQLILLQTHAKQSRFSTWCQPVLMHSLPGSQLQCPQQPCPALRAERTPPNQESNQGTEVSARRTPSSLHSKATHLHVPLANTNPQHPAALPARPGSP